MVLGPEIKKVQVQNLLDKSSITVVSKSIKNAFKIIYYLYIWLVKDTMEQFACGLCNGDKSASNIRLLFKYSNFISQIIYDNKLKKKEIWLVKITNYLC